MSSIQKKATTSTNVKVEPDGSHAPTTEIHTHAHASYGSQGGGALHKHEHEHKNDANHKHPHDGDGGNGKGVSALSLALRDLDHSLAEIIGSLEDGSFLTASTSLVDKLKKLGVQLHDMGASLHPDVCPANRSDDDDQKSGRPMQVSQLKQISLPRQTAGGTPYTMRYRAWPAGFIPQGGRPKLTRDQLILMSPYDVLGYNEGAAALVPMIDELK